MAELTHPELLADVLRSPDNDGPRFRYADALTAAGNPLGKFIREDVEAFRENGHGAFAKDAMTSEEPTDWWPAASFPKPIGYLEYERGFVVHAEVTARFLRAEQVQILFAIFPLLRSIDVLDDYGGTVAVEATLALSHHPAMQRIRALKIGAKTGVDATALVLASSPNTGGLERLDLSYSDLAASGLRALCHARPTSRPLDLHIAGCRISAADLRMCFASSRPLSQLWMSSMDLTAELGTCLTSCAVLEGLTDLRLWKNRLGKGGTFRLDGPHPLRSLRVLDASDCELKDDSVLGLLCDAPLASLEVLLVGSNKLSRGFFKRLAARSDVRRLKQLSFYGQRMGDKAAIELCSSGALLEAEVETLDLGGNDLTDRGLAELARSPGTRSLKCLMLHHNDKLTDAPREAFAGSGTTLDYAPRKKS